MRICAFLLLVLTAATIMLSAGRPSSAARNPFISAQTADEPRKAHDQEYRYPAFLRPMMLKAILLQQDFKLKMVGLAADIRMNPMGRSFWGFMFFAFLYGVIHALGPGHGKIYACAYFLNRPGTLKTCLFFSWLSMMLHVLSGSVLIVAGALVLKTSGAMTLENTAPLLERVSYLLLVLVGMWLAVRSMRQLRMTPSDPSESRPAQSDTKGLVFTAAAVGLVPCPGAALILLFSLNTGILAAGLSAMIGIAAGMAVTTSMFALLTIGLKNSFLVMARKNRGIYKAAYAGLTLIGAAGMIIFGAAFSLGGL